jgi:glucokinase
MLFEDKTQTIITADIGGTNGRFAVIEVTHDTLCMRDNVTYSCADFDSFPDMMKAFTSSVSYDGLTSAHLAIAGQTDEHSAQITNIGWSFSSTELATATGLKNISFMNDFAAGAQAVPHLRENEFRTLKAGNPVESAPMSVMGAGTGFGVAQLLKCNDEYTVISTEGGHISFAPTTHMERDLWAHLKQSKDHICIESILSGRGLARLHDFLVEYAGSGSKGLSPEEVSAHAASGDAPSCVRAVQLFLSIFGAVASDIVLAQGARGGVWVAGGIVPKIYDHIGTSDFLTRFGAKGIMSSYLTNIPINVITDTNSALIGAAADWRSKQKCDKTQASKGA